MQKKTEKNVNPSKIRKNQGNGLGQMEWTVTGGTKQRTTAVPQVKTLFTICTRQQYALCTRQQYALCTSHQVSLSIDNNNLALHCSS